MCVKVVLLVGLFHWFFVVLQKFLLSSAFSYSVFCPFLFDHCWQYSSIAFMLSQSIARFFTVCKQPLWVGVCGNSVLPGF